MTSYKKFKKKKKKNLKGDSIIKYDRIAKK